MNYFDSEKRIIEWMQDVETKQVLLIPNSLELDEVFQCISNKESWKNWIDSSGKADPTPDFYCSQYKLMMDVMRVDDHARETNKGIINPVNKRESEIQKELSSIIQITETQVFVNAISDLPSYEDHNYKQYLSNFKRIVGKHISQIGNYKKNHPGHKIIFLVMDESSGYVIVDSEETALRGGVRGEQFECKMYAHFIDRAFINCFIGSEIDYLIWFSPFKHFESNMPELPMVCIYKVCELEKQEWRDYPEKLIMGVEE